MRRYLLIAFLLVLSHSIWGQLKVSQTDFDLGDLYLESPRYADVAIKNEGDKHHFILRIEKPENIVYMFSHKRIDPDSTCILRLYVKPGAKGRFTETVKMYLSDREEPVFIEIKGNNQESPRQDIAQLQGCPDFNQSPTQADINDFDLTVRVVDEATGAPLKDANVRAFRHGVPFFTESTNRDGFIKEDGKVGLYYFEAVHDDYLPNEKDQYVNFRRNYVVIKLRKKTPEPIADVNVSDEVVTDTSSTNDPVAAIEIEKDTVTEPEKPDPIVSNTPASFEDAIEEYSNDHFKPSNIVFVIDVSSSMKDKGRLELLKIALHELKEKLRPQDRVCIVTYSTTAKVFLKSTSGDQKEAIGKLINQLYAGGYTAGGDGILLGYNQAKVNFIEGGNNQVIIVTDGAFNRGETEYKKRIAKEKEKRNINISVVGIKDSREAEESMKEVAALGSGDYVDVNRVKDAESEIIRNILKNAYRF